MQMGMYEPYCEQSTVTTKGLSECTHPARVNGDDSSSTTPNSAVEAIDTWVFLDPHETQAM